MTGRARGPEAYAHGLDGTGVVVVPAQVAAWLLERTNLAGVRQRARGDDALVDTVLVALTVAGLHWQQRTTATTTATTSATLPQPADPAAWVTTTEAANRLHVTDRAVRQQITAGRLPARRRGRRWEVDAAALPAPGRTARDAHHHTAA